METPMPWMLRYFAVGNRCAFEGSAAATPWHQGCVGLEFENEAERQAHERKEPVAGIHHFFDTWGEATTWAAS